MISHGTSQTGGRVGCFKSLRARARTRLAVDAPAMTALHVPVMLAEVLEALAPKRGDLIVDGTFGAGGYSTAILERGAEVIAFDRDPSAISNGAAIAEKSAGALRLVEAPFSSMAGHVEAADGVVLDIGVSSMQIDQALRGFSFRHDGPLDMRMASDGPTAADVVNSYKTGDLARIFNFLGEERHAGRIARMIVERREKRPFERTLELADAIETHIGRSPKDKIHPATRVFQALRIYVNDELGELARALLAAEQILKPGGRLVVVSFHSLEDRIVKRFIADRSQAQSGSRHLPQMHERTGTFVKMGGAVAPSQAETDANPRARSAKLRAAERTDAAARRADLSLFDLPKLPELRGHRES